ncbi:hypothetical protein AB4Y43_17125 [Paraburkholderia sp. BR10872]|uniref:hypothetical protein n=1 Tax=Paraburkholderia sp. BR10872 TaxID=3236989 RepID=UPI0034D28F96
MAEFIPPQEPVPGAHLPNVEATFIDLHRLLSIFLASRGFADLIEAPAGHAQELHDPLFKLQGCEEDEISRILLSLAITARVVDDAHARVLELVAGTCGRLIPDVRNPERSVNLELREACNKVIHAQRRNFDIEHNDNGRQYLTPTIYLYGQQGATEWKAVLDIVEFAKQYASCVAAVRG